MISSYFSFYIKNPYCKNKFDGILCWHEKITKYKNWEFEIIYSDAYWFMLEFDLAFTGKDHAGVRFNIGIGPFACELQIYDSRHWDYDTDTWEVYNGETDNT